MKRNIPHASTKLNKTTIAVGKGNHEIRGGKVPGSDIDQGEDKGRQCESRETKWRRVGKGGLWGLVETWLEGTAKCGEAVLLICAPVSKRIASYESEHGGL